ncbi:beta-2 adrenergic receptor-like [Hydractinia symbiolongicarpus]|uniref:beta-2 adrenergic receptor-like n=1 Tax=Hydractinia symbiolongicarpus TaxID=13093 RepID=UPI00254E811F|nr:beta-2 adrenergic receptor-like [Hydractinia symbiolongicarpus]
MVHITVIIILLCLLAVAATFVNGACIIIIYKSRTLMKRPSTFFILNLLIAQLFQGLVVFPFYAGKKGDISDKMWSRLFCDGFRFMYMLTFYLSTLGVLIIGVDRFIATFYALRYKSIVTRKRALVTILSVWLYTLSLCLLPFQKQNTTKQYQIINTSKLGENFTTVTILKHESNCTYIQSKVWTLSMLVINCLIPYIIIVLLYRVIIRKIRQLDHRIRTRAQSLCNIHAVDCEAILTKGAEQNKTLTNVSIFLSVAYLFFWSPSVIYYTLFYICPKACFIDGYTQSKAEFYVGFVTKYLAFLDSLAAPLIYCFSYEHFRKYLTFNCNLLEKSSYSPAEANTETIVEKYQLQGTHFVILNRSNVYRKKYSV